MKSKILKCAKLIMGLAVVVTAFNVNSTCMFYINQPPIPKSAKELRRF